MSKKQLAGLEQILDYVKSNWGEARVSFMKFPKWSVSGQCKSPLYESIHYSYSENVAIYRALKNL